MQQIARSIITKHQSYLWVLAAVAFSFLIHEFAHWTAGELLGYKMAMSLNQAYPAAGAYQKEWHYTLISAVGPLVTLLQTIAAFILIRRTRSRIWFPFLLSAFYLELLSCVMNFRHANDLGRISRSFGLGLFTIPVIFVIIHRLFVRKTIVRERYARKFNVQTFLLILLFSSVWILLNNIFHIMIIE